MPAAAGRQRFYRHNYVAAKLRALIAAQNQTALLIVLASGIALGSWLAAALLVVTSLPFLFYRAITEDRVLLAELPGYREYAGRVRWRLIPGVW